MKTKSLALCFAALALLCTAAAASDELKLLDITSTSPGQYLLTVAADGSISLQAARVLTVNPVPPKPPEPPSVLTERAKAVKAVAEKATADPNRAQTTVALAAAMVQVKKLVDAETLKDYATISAATAFMFDQVLSRTGSEKAWAPVRKLVMDELAKLAQEGVSAGEYSKYLQEVADGLTASAPGVMLGQSPAEAIDWAKLLPMLLEIFVKYVLPLLPIAK